MLLENRRAIVTGGARGLGAGVVRAFVREGARVACLDRDAESGRKLAGQAGSAVCFEPCDVSRRGEVDDAFARAVRALDGLDILAHCVGVEGAAAAHEIGDDEWDRVFAVRAKGTLYTNQAAYPYLRESGAGRIVNLSADGAVRGVRGAAHCAAATAAVSAWTKSAGLEWAAHGITVNAVIPPAAGEADLDRDVAPLVVFLASDLSHYLTGQALSATAAVMLG